jgi:hypothetical protein
MKTSEIMRAVLSALVVVCLSLGLTQCAKDPDMVVTIYVKLKDDTMKVIPDARVVLHKEDVEVIGYTDSQGKFVHTFRQKMYLDVDATKDTLSGRTTLRLSDPGKKYRKTVFVY